MIDSLLRPLKERVLRPVALRVGRSVSPTLISLIGFGFGIFCAFLIYRSLLGAAAVFWVLNRIFDGLDGTVARLNNRQTDWGGYVDILLDFTVYAAIPLSFAAGLGTHAALYAAAVLIAAFYINAASWMYLSILHEKKMSLGGNTRDQHTSTAMPTGIVEGTETIVFFSLFFFFPERIVVLFMLMTLATLAGIIQRVLWAGRNVRIKEKYDA